MSSCLLGLLVLWCTRANFAQNLLLMNLFMHAIVLTAILHKSCNFLIVKTSCISIFYLKHSIIVIVFIKSANTRILLLPNLDLFACPITNGDR